MDFILVDPNQAFCEAANEVFAERPEVDVVRGKFESVRKFDCVVTAGNSFGLMDAGIDLAVVKFFGPQIQDTIQAEILKHYLGEQPVGTSIIVSTGNHDHPFVAHTPTMRVPLNLNYTDNVYLATWATLVAIHNHNQTSDRPIITAVFPGFGVGTGGVDYLEATYQMLLACEHYRNPPEFLNGTLAQSRHERVQSCPLAHNAA